MDKREFYGRWLGRTVKPSWDESSLIGGVLGLLIGTYAITADWTRDYRDGVLEGLLLFVGGWLVGLSVIRLFVVPWLMHKKNEDDHQTEIAKLVQARQDDEDKHNERIARLAQEKEELVQGDDAKQRRVRVLLAIEDLKLELDAIRKGELPKWPGVGTSVTRPRLQAGFSEKLRGKILGLLEPINQKLEEADRPPLSVDIFRERLDRKGFTAALDRLDGQVRVIEKSL